MAMNKKMGEPMGMPAAPEPMRSSDADDCCGGSCGTNSCSGGSWHGTSDFGRKILVTLIGVLLVYLIVWVGTLMRNNLKKYDYIGQAEMMERTIAVMGTGKVTGSNDIAMTTLGYSNVDKDVAKAQADNKKVMDGIMKDLAGMGIAEKDLQTNYTISPEYNYTQERGQEFRGYRVANTVTIKIRDLKKISDVLGLAGKYGATEVGGLSFTIDDPENLKMQARDEALQDAEAKAVRLAQALGVRLVAVVSYNEYEGGGEYPMPYAALKDGMGGGGGPEIVATGSRDVVMNVNIVYKIVGR